MPPLDLADLNVAQGRHQLGIVCAYPLKTTRVLQLQHGTIRLNGVLATAMYLPQFEAKSRAGVHTTSDSTPTRR